MSMNEKESFRGTRLKKEPNTFIVTPDYKSLQYTVVEE